jgi:hypothetical protein
MNTFCTQWGLPNTTIQILGNNVGGNSGWALEIALDVEWAHAIAPGATIILSVANSNSDVDLLAAVDAAVAAGATIISMSFGGNEFGSEAGFDTHFNKAGVTCIASSGDGGESTSVEWPAVSPFVLGVGGTSLFLDSAGNQTSPESAWSGSGGGLSLVYSRPVYQNGWFQPSWAAMRGVPDVAYNADPNTGVFVYDLSNGGWFQVGGTSAGAPQWAALVALANQLRGGSGPLGPANSTLYGLAQGSASTPHPVNPTYFFDVTTGSNGGDADDSATFPYDLVTGVGTPVVNKLVPALAPSTGLNVTVTSNDVYTQAAHVASGIVMRNRTEGTIGLRGVPAGASLRRAYLYFNYSDTAAIGAVSSTVLFDGNAVKGVKVADNADPCWGLAGNHTYRADVTTLVRAGTPNQDYEVILASTGTTTGANPWLPTVSGKKFQGATLLVVHSASAPSAVVIYDALSGTEFSATTLTATLVHPISLSGTGLYTMSGADGQRGGGHDNTISNEIGFFNGVQLSGPPVANSDWDGSAGLPLPQLWDVHTHNASIANPSSVVKYVSSGDCLVPVVFVVQANTP